jgi:hypothetical protein
MFFRTVPSDKHQGHAAANLLIKKGYRNVAVVYEDAAYGYGLAFNFIASFTKGEQVGACLGYLQAGGLALLAEQQARHNSSNPLKARWTFTCALKAPIAVSTACHCNQVQMPASMLL